MQRLYISITNNFTFFFQGQNAWLKVQVRMAASIQGCTRSALSCKKNTDVYLPHTRMINAYMIFQVTIATNRASGSTTWTCGMGQGLV